MTLKTIVFSIHIKFHLHELPDLVNPRQIRRVNSVAPPVAGSWNVPLARSPISHFSTFAAYPDTGHFRTSQAFSQFTMNSWLAEPPMGPLSASTAE
ncbi:MAG: hypothetical protein KF705_09615 [Phycisphaeraceae bacterium]|nr:hypothetical protein [Phycisphaeraceae bacterium]